MKTLVEKMAKGNIDYQTPDIIFSENKIDIEIEPDMEAHGSFTVSSANGREVKGIIYSSHDILTIVNDQFAGGKCNIKYIVKPKNVKPGQVIDGTVDIVSSSGPYTIPYHIVIKGKSIVTSAGAVENLDDFARLAQTSYEEAFKIFYSDKFKKVIIKDDMRGNAVYDALMENWNRHLAMEEFLVASCRKKRVEIALDGDGAEFNELKENVSGIINIKKSGWGYTDISVNVSGEFLYNCKEKVTYDDFAGNNCEYQYLINVNKLHRGVNKARITFSTYSQELVYDITVKVPYESRSDFEDSKHYIYDLMKSYLEFRTEKISVNQWINDTEKMINDRLSKYPKDYLSMLIKSQVMLTTGMENEAAALISEAADVIIPNRQSAIEMYSYYLYVKTLQKNNPSFTLDVKKEITEYYENGHDSWELLWILLYLEDRYQVNASLKYTAIKEQFSQGVTSPMLYFEALKVLNEQPGLLRVLNKFEIQVICFGSKYRYISDGLKKQLLELIPSSKISGRLMFNILSSLYEQQQDDGVLEAICGLLIRENKTDSKYFKWYDSAIRAGLNITRLYEFYMYTIDGGYKGELLPAVYMYFNYNADSIMQKKDFLYCNIIENKENRPSTYESYKKTIHDYALEQIRERNMNRYLNVIYKDILYDRLITEDTAEPLAGILQTCKVTCDNPNMKEVIAFHKESMEGQRAKLRDGEAYIKIYTKDPVIVFADSYGNRYCGSVDYTIERLMNNDNFLDKCLEFNSDNEFLSLHYAEKYIDEGEPMKAVNIFSDISDWEELGGICKRQIIKNIIEFYCDNYDGDILDGYISKIDMEKQDSDTRNRIMEILVSRGNTDRALECISKYGFEGISAGRLQVFCSRIIEEHEFEENKMLLGISYFVFSHGKFDNNILKYLSMYYYGTTEEMYRVWEQCAAEKCLTVDFEEKLIAQMLFERNCAKLQTVFVSYAAKGGKRKVKNAVFSYYAFENFIMGEDVSYDIYQIMETELLQKYDMPDICKISFLYSNAGREELTEQTVNLCKKILYDLSEYNVNFEFFKQFNKWFNVPANIVDKTVFDYKTNPNYRVSMEYRFSDTEWINKEMRQTYPGVFVKELPLFYGDEIEYLFIVDDGVQEIKTQPAVYKVDNKTIYNGETRFGMINDMLICDKLNKKASLVQLAKTYTVSKEVADKLFKIL